MAIAAEVQWIMSPPLVCVVERSFQADIPHPANNAIGNPPRSLLIAKKGANRDGVVQGTSCHELLRNLRADR